MTKSKLEKAIEDKAASLGNAQKEIVLSQLATYKRNKSRIGEIDDVLVVAKNKPSAEHARLSAERNQLVITNSDILSKMFQQLESKD